VADSPHSSSPLGTVFGLSLSVVVWFREFCRKRRVYLFPFPPGKIIPVPLSRSPTVGGRPPNGDHLRLRSCPAALFFLPLPSGYSLVSCCFLPFRSYSLFSGFAGRAFSSSPIGAMFSKSGYPISFFMRDSTVVAPPCLVLSLPWTLETAFPFQDDAAVYDFSLRPSCLLPRPPSFGTDDLGRSLAFCFCFAVFFYCQFFLLRYSRTE